MFLIAIQYSAILATLLAICVGFRRRGLLWYYACISFGSDVCVLSLKPYKPDFSMVICSVVNFFLIAQYFCIGLYLCRSVFRRPKVLWRALLLFSLPGSYFVAHTLLAYRSSLNFDDAPWLYGTLIVLCLLALYRVMLNVEHVRIERSSLFLVAASFLLYASGSFLLLQFDHYLTSHYSKDFVNQLWGIHGILGIPKSLAIARALTLPTPSFRPGDI